jgi:hypothetical protein
LNQTKLGVSVVPAPPERLFSLLQRHIQGQGKCTAICGGRESAAETVSPGPQVLQRLICALTEQAIEFVTKIVI